MKKMIKMSFFIALAVADQQLAFGAFAGVGAAVSHVLNARKKIISPEEELPRPLLLPSRRAELLEQWKSMVTTTPKESQGSGEYYRKTKAIAEELQKEELAAINAQLSASKTSPSDDLVKLAVRLLEVGCLDEDLYVYKGKRNCPIRPLDPMDFADAYFYTPLMNEKYLRPIYGYKRVTDDRAYGEVKELLGVDGLLSKDERVQNQLKLNAMRACTEYGHQKEKCQQWLDFYGDLYMKLRAK